MKKLLALVLALVMTLSLCITSNAAYTDAADIDYDEAVEVMSALGVLQGTDGKFNPKDVLTREQAAKIVTYMLLGKSAADALVTIAAPFADVAADRWSAGSIAYCYNEGILAGVGNGQFAPTAQLTGLAFAKMMLVALGYDAEQEGLTGSQWSINAAKLALTVGLTDGMDDVSLSAPMTREQAAKMAFNTELADMVEYGNNSTITAGNVTIKTQSKAEKIGAKSVTGGYAGYKTAAADNDAYVQFCEQYAGNLKLTTVGVDDYNVPATEWNYKNEKVGNYSDNSAVLATYTTEVSTVTLGDLYKLCPTGTGADLTLEVYENGTANGTVVAAKGSTTKALKDAGYQGATVYVVDDDADGKADSLCVKYSYLAKVTKVTAETASKDRYVTLTVYNKSAGTELVTYETEDFAKDDYVLVFVDGKVSETASMNANKLTKNILEVEAAESVKGTVSTVSGTNGTSATALTVAGTKYTVAADDYAKLGLTSDKAVKDSTYSFKTETTLFLANGFVVGVKGASGAKTNIENIVYVTKAAYTAKNSFNEKITYVETVALDGTIEIVEKGTGTVAAAGFYVKEYDSTDKNYDFTPVEGANAIDNTTVYYGVDTVDGPVSMKATTKTVAVDTATKAYVTSDSALVFVFGTGSKLTVSVNNGAMKQTIADGSAVLLSQDSDDNYIVEAIIVGAKKVDVSADTVYVKGTATGSNADGNEYSMYDLATGEKTTITVGTGETDFGYVTYSVDADGVYDLAAVSKASANNGDGQYEIAAAKRFSKYGDSTISVNVAGSDKDIVDLDAADAVIISLVDDYESLSLADLAGAKTLTGVVLVKDEAVTSIVVTDYAPKA